MEVLITGLYSLTVPDVLRQRTQYTPLRVLGDGIEIDLEYDAWGRTVHADMIVPEVDTFTMDMTYWYGDKLKRAG